MLGIGALSKKTGGNIETIHYYETICLMASLACNEGGHRMCGQIQVKRLPFILRHRGPGSFIDKYRSLPGMVDGDAACRAEDNSVTEAHLGDMCQKFSNLRHLETVLAKIVSQCSGPVVPGCPIIDTVYGLA